MNDVNKINKQKSKIVIKLLWIFLSLCLIGCNDHANGMRSQTETWYKYEDVKYSSVYMQICSKELLDTIVFIMEQITVGEDEIDFTEIGANDLTVQYAMQCASFQNPLCSKVTLAKQTAGVYRVEYGCTTEEWKNCVEVLRNKVSTVILENVPEDGTEQEKAKAIYGYLSRNMVYDRQMMEAQDTEALYAHNLYDAIVEEQGVCFHFAQIYFYYLMQMDINSIVVADMGVVNPDEEADVFGRLVPVGLGHAWNMVELDDVWYQCDVTFENTYFEQLREYDSSIEDIPYEFWGMSDAKRNESRSSIGLEIYGPKNPMKPLKIPKCEKEL